MAAAEICIFGDTYHAAFLLNWWCMKKPHSPFSGSQGLGLEPNKDFERTNIRFCKDHRKS